MKVMVTGHRGYVGTIMVPMLKDKGYDLVGLDNNYYSEPEAYDCENPFIIKDHLY